MQMQRGPEEPQTYRTVFARVVAVLVVLACLVALVTTGVTDTPALLRTGWVFAGVGVAAWALFWRPYVRLDDEAVELSNVVRTVIIPWAAVTAVDSRWSFTVETGAGRYGSWSAPGRSGSGERTAMMRRSFGGRSDPDRLTDGRRDRPESSRNDAAAVALDAAERLRRLRAESALGSDTTVRTRWHVAVVASAGVVVAWAAVSRLL